MKPWLIYLPFLFLVILASCSSDDIADDFDNGTDYIPLTEGSWYEYRVDSTVYNDLGNTVDESEWDFRIEIGDTVTSNENERVVRMLRYQKRRNSTADYQFEKAFFAKIENGRLETYEDNLHFVKLLFPVVEGKEWEGNRFIQPAGNDNPNTSTQFYEGWEYEYVSVGESQTINGNDFENVIHVNQSENEGGPGAINHFVSDEWYAKGVGLVKKRMEIVVENCGGDDCSEKNLPVLERTRGRKGFILDMEITDYEVN